MRVAVVGHVEWAQFARVPEVPAAGELVAASEWWEDAAGGAAVAAMQALRLGAEVELFTALGDDEHGREAHRRLEARGLTVHAMARGVQRRAFVFLDGDGERTITVLGERTVPAGDDELPWERLADADAAYFTGGDAAALTAARRARLLVATPRAGDVLREAGVRLDVLVRSARDPGECRAGDDLDPRPHRVVSTAGREGGRWVGEDRTEHVWRAARLPGPPGDAYGAGDSFAGGLTWALGADLDIEAALGVAARCGAAKLSGRAAYDGQLTAEEL